MRYVLLGLLAIWLPARAMSVGEVLALPEATRTAYLIGVMDRWAIEMSSTACQDKRTMRELFENTWRYMASIEAEPPTSTRGRMRNVPAAMAVQFELSRFCAEGTKK